MVIEWLYLVTESLCYLDLNVKTVRWVGENEQVYTILATLLKCNVNWKKKNSLVFTSVSMEIDVPSQAQKFVNVGQMCQILYLLNISSTYADS